MTQCHHCRISKKVAREKASFLEVTRRVEASKYNYNGRVTFYLAMLVCIA